MDYHKGNLRAIAERHKTFMLEPFVLEGLMEDTLGMEISPPGLAQTLLDGGLETEHLAQRYPTDRGEMNLLMVLLCQNDLAVDFDTVAERLDVVYDQLDRELDEYRLIHNLNEDGEGNGANPGPSGEAPPNLSFQPEKEVETPAHVPRFDAQSVRFGDAPRWNVSAQADTSFPDSLTKGVGVFHSGSPEKEQVPHHIMVGIHRATLQRGKPNRRMRYTIPIWSVIVKRNFPVEELFPKKTVDLINRLGPFTLRKKERKKHKDRSSKADSAYHSAVNYFTT